MFDALFVITFILSFLALGFGILLVVSPKLRGKIMSTQVKATKYMMDESKEDLKSIADDTADVSKDAITTTTRAIKKGFTKDTIYCKHCGSEIDSDSKFCKSCGKEQ